MCCPFTSVVAGTHSPKPIQEAGLGNALFATAGIIALAHRFNMLPVLPCRKNNQLDSALFRNMHCVDNKDPQLRWQYVPTKARFALSCGRVAQPIQPCISLLEHTCGSFSSASIVAGCACCACARVNMRGSFSVALQGR